MTSLDSSLQAPSTKEEVKALQDAIKRSKEAEGDTKSGHGSTSNGQVNPSEIGTLAPSIGGQAQGAGQERGR